MATGTAARISAIYRYPVKGLSAEALDSVTLAEGDSLPFDRAYAVENGPSGFDPAAPTFLAKIHFLMLMKNARLAQLRSCFDEKTVTLTVKYGSSLVRGRLDTPDGRAAIEGFLSGFMAEELRGPPRVLSAADHTFADCGDKVVSIINIASVRALSQAIGRPLDPLRFRANLYVDGIEPWAEREWIGARLATTAVELSCERGISRCAATDVDPATGVRDTDIPRSLEGLIGERMLGLYARVRIGGRLARGELLVPKKS